MTVLTLLGCQEMSPNYSVTCYSKDIQLRLFSDRTNDLEGLDRAEGQYQRRILRCTRLIRSQEFLDGATYR